MQVNKSMLVGALRMLQGLPFSAHGVVVLNDEFVGKVMYYKTKRIAMLNSTGEMLVRTPPNLTYRTEQQYLEGMLQAVEPDATVRSINRRMVIHCSHGTYNYDGLCILNSGWLNIHQLLRGAYVEYSD